MIRKNGLNDSDKIFVTVALWISMITLFATALSLPMLPDMITIFYKPLEGGEDYFSKYNNLLLVIMSIIPASIVLLTASLKKRNRLQNNFMSIVLFSIMLSVCISSIMIYGLLKQFDASSSVRYVNIHAVIVLFALFVLSMLCALVPTLLHAPGMGKAPHPVLSTRFVANAGTLWNYGAYGYLACAIAASFIPHAYCYIALGVGVIAHCVLLIVYGKKHQ